MDRKTVPYDLHYEAVIHCPECKGMQIVDLGGDTLADGIECECDCCECEMVLSNEAD